jgi:HAD superfamily hydrolase (TIGR01509 family)
MVFDEEEGVAKPDARIYLRTLLRLGVQPEEAVFVDDKMENVEAARQLGMHSIHFQHTEQALAEIQEVLRTA